MNLKQLRTLAEAATQDTRAYGSAKCNCGHPVCNKWHLNMASSNGGIEEKDALFISKFHPQAILKLLDLVELQFRANHWAQQELIMWDHAEGGADFKYLDSPCVEALAAYDAFNKEQ